MDIREIRKRLDDQDWRCVYQNCVYAESGRIIEPGEPIARAYDQHGIIHLKCAQIGVAPRSLNADV